MTSPLLIAIFDDDLKAAAFLSVLPGQEISLETIGNMNEKRITALNALIASFKNSPPRMKSEILNNSEITVGLQQINPGSSNYLPAIAEELNIAGFTAKILPAVLRPILIYYSLKLNRKQREAVLRYLANVSYDIEEQAVEQLKGLLLDMEELKEPLPEN
jgi:uncharacterized small protein (DUF1192 family)